MKTLLQNDYRHILKIKSKCLYDKNGGEWIIDKGSGNPQILKHQQSLGSGVSGKI
jgi:hypothetical protein